VNCRELSRVSLSLPNMRSALLAYSLAACVCRGNGDGLAPEVEPGTQNPQSQSAPDVLEPARSQTQQKAFNIGADKLGMPNSELELSWGRESKLGLINFRVYWTGFKSDHEGYSYEGLYDPQTGEYLDGDAALSRVVSKLLPTIDKSVDAEALLTQIAFYWRGLLDVPRGSLVLKDNLESQQRSAKYSYGPPTTLTLPTRTQDGETMVIHFWVVSSEGDLVSLDGYLLRIDQDGNASLKMGDANDI